MKICFLFPGQGAQYPGMGKDLWEESKKVKELFELASDCTGINLKTLIFEGSEDELKQTDKTQIAITLINLSSDAVLWERGITASGYAGFSLGEYSALERAGILKTKDLFAIVKQRGDVMGSACSKLTSPSGMSAVIGMKKEEIETALKESGTEDVFLANHNSLTQIVLSGTENGLSQIEPVLKEKGARRVIRLKVSGPFHSPLIIEAKRQFAEVIKDFQFSDPVKPVYSNVTGKKITTGAEAKELCLEQIVSTVKWVDVENSILADGFEKCIESGPGKVLSGLWKSIGNSTICYPAGKIENINNL